MITYDDIKLMASERLTDDEDGGGQMSGIEVVDGNVNNLFPDKSRLDMVYGRVSLRKAFLAILSDNQDTYYGSHVVLTQQAEDPRVKVSLFTTNDMDDERLEAKDYIEGYVVPTIAFAGQLEGTHIAGSMALSLVQRLDRQVPEGGDILYLVENEGDPDEQAQYVKIITVESQEVSYYDPITQSDFILRRSACSINTILLYDFHGPEVTKNTSQGGVHIYDTTVADAARYYSVSPLIEAAEVGDLVLKAESIWTHIVPSAQAEAVIADAKPAEDVVPVIADGTTVITRSMGYLTIPAGGRIYLLHAMQRGSLAMTVGTGTYTDDEKGNLLNASESIVGTVTYNSGEILFSAGTSGTTTVQFKPAGAPTLAQNSEEIVVSLENRALNYVRTLSVPVNPGTLRVDYMAQGEWYTLRDGGETDLAGIGIIYPDVPNTGVGSINRTTNTVTITLGALPDVGSSILFRWGEIYEYESRAGTTDVINPAIKYTVLVGSVDPSSLTISWNDGAPKSVTDNGAGVLTGNGTGTVNYSTGEIVLRPTLTFAAATIFNFVYTAHALQTDLEAQTLLPWTFTLDTTVVQSSTLKAKIQVKYENAFGSSGVLLLDITDDGAGNLIIDGAQSRRGDVVPFKGYGDVILYGFGPVYNFANGAVLGTINYTTGECAITQVPCVSDKATYGYTLPHVTADSGSTSHAARRSEVTIVEDVAITTDMELITGYSVNIYYQQVAAGQNPYDEDLAINEIVIDLTPYSGDEVVPSSVLFTFNNKTFQDREGSLYRDVLPLTGLGTNAGTFNYDTGQAILDDWGSGGQAWTLTVNGLMVSRTSQGVSAFVFRTAGTPLRPGSFQMLATLDDGTLQNATADVSGDFVDSLLEGHVDNETGLVWVRFGEWVPITEAEGEPWYNDESDDGLGNTWKPAYALGSTVRYNCVVYEYIPLDPSLLGLDPVRLPTDGRVPALRKGYIALVHNTVSEVLPLPLVAGAMYSVGRNPISLIELFDQDGLYVPKTFYSENLTTGEITMVDPLDLSDYVQPLIANTRIEDMVLLTDVQINGTLGIASQLTYDYPANTSYVSGVLPFGDKRARYHHLFDQQTWQNHWYDIVEGNPATGTYDDVNYPIIVTNEGAATQRWAIVFTAATIVNILGEFVGQIVTGASILDDIAPINPATGVPYFTIQLGGWGAGWASGNALRFNTDGARCPMWFCRTTLQGPSTEPEDKFTVQLRGDAD
jgi:hypothetical protein